MTPKTLLYLLAAIGAVLIALMSGPSEMKAALFADKGEEFFPEFTSSEPVAALQVSVFSPRLGAMYRFRVQKNSEMVMEEVDGEERPVQKIRWTIPSHHGYPADGTEYVDGNDVNRIALEATAFIGLRKFDVISDEPSVHPDYQVLDPELPGLEEEGYGRRVSFEDRDANLIASLIIGKAVPGKSDQYYVRIPEKNRTYVAKIDRTISTRFEDWIEDDLLQVDSYKIASLRSDAYSIDETTLSQTPGEQFSAKKVDGQWVLDDLEDHEETETSKLTGITSALDALSIVGVRPKPDDLVELLAGRTNQVSRGSLDSLLRQGFYPTNSGQLLANEGELVATTEEGVAYRLMFGEVLFGEGDDITAGGAEAEDASDGEQQPKADQATASRYLMIMPIFDATQIATPDEEALDAATLSKRSAARVEIERLLDAVNKYREVNNDALPDNLAALIDAKDIDGEPCLKELKKDPWGGDYQLRPSDDANFVIFSGAEDQAEGGLGAGADVSSGNFDHENHLNELRREWDSREESILAGQETVRELSERFAPWYYVINDESFQKLRVARADLVKEKEADESAADEFDAPFELPDPSKANNPFESLDAGNDDALPLPDILNAEEVVEEVASEVAPEVAEEGVEEGATGGEETDATEGTGEESEGGEESRSESEGSSGQGEGSEEVSPGEEIEGEIEAGKEKEEESGAEEAGGSGEESGDGGSGADASEEGGASGSL